MSAENGGEERTERLYVSLGVGGLLGLTWLEEPFGVFEVILHLFFGAFLIGASAYVLIHGFIDTNKKTPSWGSISVALSAVYAVFLLISVV